MGVSFRISGRKVPAMLLLVLLMLCVAYQNMNLSRPPRLNTVIRSRRLMKLVDEQPTLSEGELKPIIRPVLAETLPVYIIWYGDFSDAQKSIVLDFFQSFDSTAENVEQRSPFSGFPTSVGSWWRAARGTSRVHLESDLSNTAYSKGRSLSSADIQDLALQHSQESFPENALYLVLTSDDVDVEGFCVNSCAARNHVSTSSGSDGERVLQVTWVGNPATQCPEQCAWPLAAKPMEPEQLTRAVLPPNGDVGMDGMVINIVGMLAGAASMTPFHDGTVQEGLVKKADSSLSPSTLGLSNDEVAVCRGVFGDGAHPGFQGHLWTEKLTGTSFNAVGANDRRFLLPSLWDSAALKCRIPS